MDQKGFEKKLDEVTAKISNTVSEGIRRVGERFEKDKDKDPETTSRRKNLAISPSGGMIIVLIGFLWLLYTLGVFEIKLFPILLILFGLYLIFRKRHE
jgi:hypothetical protein